MIVARSNGLVVTPDWCGGTPLGSILHPGKGRFILSLSTLSYDSLKFFIFLFFYTAGFLLVKNTSKYPYSLKAVNEENSWKIRGYRENRCKVLAARRIFRLNT
jgi:hypothetical protein